MTPTLHFIADMNLSPLSNTDPGFVTLRLKRIIVQVEQALHEGSAVTVDDVNMRIRRLPIR